MKDSLLKKQTFFFFPIFFLIICISFVFFVSQLYQSSQKPFWGDEVFGLKRSIQQDSYSHLIKEGAIGQGSPAPLDYLVCKVIDQIGQPNGLFGLSPEVYHRLYANGITSVVPFLILILYLLNIRNRNISRWIIFVQLILIVFTAIAYLFSQNVYYYAAEIRPYASWTAFWMLSLAASLFSLHRCLWFALVLLAFTATTSFFQIGVMFLAYLIIFYKRANGLKVVFVDALKIFAVPAAIAFYYCLKVTPWNCPFLKEEWDQFLHLWVHEAVLVPIMLIALISCFLKKENRAFAIAPLSMLLLFLIGPLIFWTTKLKGFFYAERQYIYYDLTNAVFLLTILQCLPAYLKSIKGKGMIVLVCFCVLIVAGSFTFRPKVVHKLTAAIDHVQEVFKNPMILKSSN